MTGELKGQTPSAASEHHCWPPYDDNHQNHNCLHCCPFLILTAEVFNLRTDLFQPPLSLHPTRTEEAFFIKLLIGALAEAASLGKA